MHNLVVFIEPPPKNYEIALEAGNKCLNRFCIDEDASFDLSGVYFLKISSETTKWCPSFESNVRGEKGKECLFLRHSFICFIRVVHLIES